jgi:hypothetical protein
MKDAGGPSPTTCGPTAGSYPVEGTPGGLRTCPGSAVVEAEQVKSDQALSLSAANTDYKSQSSWEEHRS